MSISHPYACLHLVIVRIAANMIGIRCIGARLPDFGHFFAKYTASLSSAKLFAPGRPIVSFRIMSFNGRRGVFFVAPFEIWKKRNQL